MKKIDEMRNDLEALKEKMQTAINNKNVEEAKNLKKEIENMKEMIALQEELDKEEAEEINKKRTDEPKQQKDAMKEFAEAARKGFPKNSMSEGSDEDGGYTVPEEIETKITKYRESKVSLLDYVDVKTTKKMSGQQTYKKRSQQTGFQKVGEGGKIQGKNTPQFCRMRYEIQKYAGYFPVSNELLEDSDANITTELVSWIGDESRVTRNNIVLNTVKDNIAVTRIGTTDDIKKIINVTLGAEFKNTSKIYTNDDGFNWLDTLKDKDGKYLLQPSVTDPTKYRLFGVDIITIPNKDMSSDVSTEGKRKIPFLIGDLKEAVRFYDRKKLTIMTSNIASVGDLNAFEEDLTLFRAIEREDCKIKDEKAVVYGEIEISETVVTKTAK